ncbi:MAG: PaaI family thioesterase [Pelistega sp.]|nr:PaaI family thioesterase [Pelistega sp.]
MLMNNSSTIDTEADTDSNQNSTLAEQAQTSQVPTTIPYGFTPFDTKSRFVQLCGPMYEKVFDDNTVALGLLLEEQHLNQLDLAHGGILMTLADNAMGRTLSFQSEWQSSYVTLSMNSQFMQSAQLGEFIYAKVSVTRKGRRLVFLESEIKSANKLLFHASATFAVLEKKA